MLWRAKGRRVFVVLMGEDSLEANVGHLAALSGGDLRFAIGTDTRHAVAAILAGLRTKCRVADGWQCADQDQPDPATAAEG